MFWAVRSEKAADNLQLGHRSSSASSSRAYVPSTSEVRALPPSDAIRRHEFNANGIEAGGLTSTGRFHEVQANGFEAGDGTSTSRGNTNLESKAIDAAFPRENKAQEASQNDWKPLLQEVDMIVSQRLRDQSISMCEVLRQVVKDELWQCFQSFQKGATEPSESTPQGKKWILVDQEETSKKSGLALAKDNVADPAAVSFIDEASEKFETSLGIEGEDAIAKSQTKPITRKMSTWESLDQLMLRDSFFDDRLTGMETRQADLHMPVFWTDVSDKRLASQQPTPNTIIGAQANMVRLNELFHFNSSLLDIEWTIYLQKLAVQWANLKEPVRKGFFANLEKSKWFETICVVVIVANSIWLAYNADYEMKNLNRDKSIVARILSYIFAGFYLIEISIRLAVHRGYFFVNEDMGWNIFDTLLVLVSVVVIVMEWVLQLQGRVANVTFVRVLRLCRFAKILRALRAMRFFNDLSIMIQSITNSALTLFWTLIIISFVLYLFALIFLQGMVDYLSDLSNGTEPAIPEQTQAEIDQHFGSTSSAMISLYMSMTGGVDWGVYYELINKTGSFYGFLYMFFTFIFTFAMFSMLTAIVVEKASYAAQPDRDDLVLQRWTDARRDAKEFRSLFHALDQNGDSKVTWKEFESQMSNELVVAYMASIGLEIHEAELFFQLLAGATNSDEVSIDRFVEGCMLMKGCATAIDMQRLMFHVDLMHMEMKRFQITGLQNLQSCARGLDALNERLNKTGSL